jgi:glycosyltransferase involved in cell wall biosynthesis
MKRIAFIVRSTLHTVSGGDTRQVLETAHELKKLGLDVDIILAHEKINYSQYNLLHFFNLGRPADILRHLKKTDKPIVISPIWIDYSEYDRLYRKGISGRLFRLFSPMGNEYLKTLARSLKGNDRLNSFSYLLTGHQNSIRAILARTNMLLYGSPMEESALLSRFNYSGKKAIVPLGIDPHFFQPNTTVEKNKKGILCAARIEGIKNQLNLIRAVNNTEFELVLAGNPAPNQKKYYTQCVREAAGNIRFLPHQPAEELKKLYAQAYIHILPSWFETCGLSTLEAAAMNCRIVVSDRGYVRDYVGDHASYCDPGNPASIINALRKAASQHETDHFTQYIRQNFTWNNAALKTRQAYQTLL